MWEAQIWKSLLRVMSSPELGHRTACAILVPFESSSAATLFPVSAQVSKLILWIRRFILEATAQSVLAKLWIVQVRLELNSWVSGSATSLWIRTNRKGVCFLEPALDAVQTQENQLIINLKLLNCSSRKKD